VYVSSAIRVETGFLAFRNHCARFLRALGIRRLFIAFLETLAAPSTWRAAQTSKLYIIASVNMLNSEAPPNYASVEDGSGTSANAEPPRRSWGRILAATLACVALATIAVSRP
jgi:hypothetical protein